MNILVEMINNQYLSNLDKGILDYYNYMALKIFYYRNKKNSLNFSHI